MTFVACSRDRPAVRRRHTGGRAQPPPQVQVQKVQVQKVGAKRLCRRRLQWLCACGRMRISAYVPRGAGERTVMTALPLSLAGNGASGVDCCWLAPVLQMAAVASGNWPLWPEPGPEGWTCFPRVATRSLDMKPKPVRAARDFAVATVQRWGAAECADDVAIVVSELVTNALRHALPAPARLRGAGRSGLACCGPGHACYARSPTRAGRFRWRKRPTYSPRPAAGSMSSARSPTCGATPHPAMRGKRCGPCSRRTRERDAASPLGRRGRTEDWPAAVRGSRHGCRCGLVDLRAVQQEQGDHVGEAIRLRPGPEASDASGSTWRMPDMAAMFDRLRDAAAACDDLSPCDWSPALWVAPCR